MFFKKEKMLARKPKVSVELMQRILKLHHDENLESGEIAQILDIPERDVVMIINPHW